MRPNSRALAYCILAFNLVACDGAPSNTPDDASVPPGEDGGPGPDGGPPGESLVVTREGERIFGPVLALTRQDRALWMGTITIADPSSPTGALRGGLVRVDLDEGAVRAFEAELPETESPGGEGRGPVSTAGVVQDGDRTLVVSQRGILVGDGEGDFALHRLTVEGADASPTHLLLDRGAGRDARLWAATDRGLLLLDPDTLAITRRLDAGAIGGSFVGALAVDPASGALTVASDDPTTGASFLARVDVGADPEVTLLDRAAAGVTGRIAEVAWSGRLEAAVFTASAFDATAGGLFAWGRDGAVTTLATEGQLALAARGEAVAFGASALAVDDADGVIVVGGSIRSTGPASGLIGGGIAWIDARRLSEGLFATGLSTATSDLKGDFVTALAYDPVSHRTFASLRQPCSEVRLGNAGVAMIAFDAGRPVFETPAPSGVRDLALLDGALVAALRDDHPGSQCDGVGIQTSLVGMREAGVGEALDMRSVGGDGEFSVWRTTRVGPSRLDFTDADHRLVASYRNDVYVGGDRGHTFNPALNLGVALDTRAITWLGDDVFAIGGGTSHDATDTGDLANVGPHGMAIVRVGEAGRLLSHTLYVRAVRDPSPTTVTGLPTNEIWDLVPGPEGSVYVLAGVERLRRGVYERVISEPFLVDGAEVLGGVARILADGTLEVLAAGEEVPDPRAGALDADGSLLVLDARRGLLRVGADGLVSEEALPVAVPEGAVPTSLSIGDHWLVATFSTGAIVRLGELTTVVDGVGWAWSSIERADGVLAIGTDRGVVEVRRASTARPTAPPRSQGDLPPYALIDTSEPPPGGECLPERAACAGTPDACCPGLTCAGSGFVNECVRR